MIKLADKLVMSDNWRVRYWVIFVSVIIVACTSPIRQNQSTISNTDIKSGKPNKALNSEKWPESFGFGRLASISEITALDIDVRPDGKGLPAGSGTVLAGKAVYANKCAACHGATGVEGPNNRLVGPASESTQPNSKLSPEKTIGNYWPYATTLFDYIRRAMPFNAPGSLTNEEVYALTAFLLHANKIIPPDATMNAETLPRIVMPAQKYFVTDDRRGGPEVR
jgi:S-disulfanyl-L-cysteine oxidoreductase SoxD